MAKPSALSAIKRANLRALTGWVAIGRQSALLSPRGFNGSGGLQEVAFLVCRRFRGFLSFRPFGRPRGWSVAEVSKAQNIALLPITGTIPHFVLVSVCS